MILHVLPISRERKCSVRWNSKTGSFLLFDNLNPRYSISRVNYRQYLGALCIFHGDLDGLKMWLVARKLSPKLNRCVKLLFVKYTVNLLYSQLFPSENIPNLMHFKNLPIRLLGFSTRVICPLWQYSDQTGRFNVKGGSILLPQLGTNTFEPVSHRLVPMLPKLS